MLTHILLLPLMAYAAAGLALSVTAHLLSYAGIQLGGNGLFNALHVGIFPLWIPVVLIAMKMSGGRRSGDLWKRMLADCPAWMTYLMRGFIAYAVVNFILCAALLAFVYPKGGTHGSPPPDLTWRMFSGHWMVFYGAGLLIVTTAWRRGLSNLQRRCTNGHAVAYGDRFCPTCGAPLDTTPTVPDRAAL
jgi:hypothetical protein